MLLIYCARGQAENLIKLHKGQLASDRTSCQSPLANQFRLVLHTAAYWLMLALRDAVPRRMPLAWAEFATLRKNLLKVGARVVEKAARIRIHFASACRMPPCSACWPGASRPRAPDRRAPCPANPSPFNLPTQTPPTSNPDAAWRRTQSHARIKSTDKLRLR